MGRDKSSGVGPFANVPALKVAHHMEHTAAMVRYLADQLDTMLLDMDSVPDEFTDLVSELESVADYADELAVVAMKEAK